MARRHIKQNHFGLYTDSNRRDPLAKETRRTVEAGAPRRVREMDARFVEPVNPKRLSEKIYGNIAHRANKGVAGSRKREAKASILYDKIQKRYGNR